MIINPFLTASSSPREIAQIDPGELVRDTNATRNYCNFLVEVAGTCGPVVLSAIPSLLQVSYYNV